MDAAMGANCWVDIFNSSYGRTNLRSQPITHANSEGQHSAWRKAASPRRRDPLCADAATWSLPPMISAGEFDGLIIPRGSVRTEKRVADREFESWNTIALATFLFEGECHGNIPNPVDGFRPPLLRHPASPIAHKLFRRLLHWARVAGESHRGS